MPVFFSMGSTRDGDERSNNELMRTKPGRTTSIEQHDQSFDENSTGYLLVHGQQREHDGILVWIVETSIECEKKPNGRGRQNLVVGVRFHEIKHAS